MAGHKNKRKASSEVAVLATDGVSPVEGGAARATSTATARSVDGVNVMPKGGSAPGGGKQPLPVDEIDDIFTRKRPAQPKSGSDEIDRLFGAIKNGTQKKAKTSISNSSKRDRAASSAPGAPPEQPNRVEGNKDDLFGEAGSSGRKRTEEGYGIYSEEELGFANYKGGDTDLCPFDCDCCF